MNPDETIDLKPLEMEMVNAIGNVVGVFIDHLFSTPEMVRTLRKNLVETLEQVDTGTGCKDIPVGLPVDDDVDLYITCIGNTLVSARLDVKSIVPMAFYEELDGQVSTFLGRMNDVNPFELKFDYDDDTLEAIDPRLTKEAMMALAYITGGELP